MPPCQRHCFTAQKPNFKAKNLPKGDHQKMGNNRFK